MYGCTAGMHLAVLSLGKCYKYQCVNSQQQTISPGMLSHLSSCTGMGSVTRDFHGISDILSSVCVYLHVVHVHVYMWCYYDYCLNAYHAMHTVYNHNYVAL